FNLGFYDYLTGIRPLPAGRKWGPPAHDQRSKYVCVEPLAAPSGLGLVDEYRRLRDVTSAPAKVAVPGPYTLAGCLDGGDMYRGRAVGHRSYRPLFPHIGRAAVGQLALEFASREMAEVELLRELPDSMGIAVGLVDVKNTWVEPAELVAERLRQVLKYVEPE